MSKRQKLFIIIGVLAIGVIIAAFSGRRFLLQYLPGGEFFQEKILPSQVPSAPIPENIPKEPNDSLISLAGTVEFIDEPNRSFVLTKIEGGKKKTFDVLVDENTSFVRIVYPQNYDPLNPPLEGVLVQQVPAEFSDIKIGDSVLVRIGQPTEEKDVVSAVFVEIEAIR